MIALFFASLSAHAIDTPASNSESELKYTASQAERGRVAFIKNCAACHGASANGGAFAGSLKGDKFREAFDGKSAKALFDFVTSKMPPADPGGLSKKAYWEILAFVLQVNGVSPSTTEISSDGINLGSVVVRLPKIE